MDVLELQARFNVKERELRQLEHDRCIEFFGVVDEERAWSHSADNPDSLCKCNLFKGANPKQAELLRAWLDERYKVFTFTGGNKLGKCLSKEALISTPKGEIPLGELYEQGDAFRVFAWNGREKVIANAEAPFKKEGLHRCYEITLSDGAVIIAADKHRVLTSHGWFFVEQLQAFFGIPQESISDVSQSGHVLDDEHLNRRRFKLIGSNMIKYIKPIPTCQEVYDFQVETYHNYFAGGLIHHNTTLGSVLAVSLMFGHFPWDIRKVPISRPPIKIRYIGQDWDSHVKEVVEPAVEKWFPKNRVVETRKNNQGIKNEWIDKSTGSELFLMSNKQEVGVFEGWDGGYIIYDEPPRREIRIACARGLAVTNGRELFCATLLKEPWIDREVIKKTLPDGRPDPQVFNVHGEIYDNLGFGLTEEGIKSFASKLTDNEKQERLYGVPSYLKGLIYPQFKREIHLKKRFKIPLDWLVDIAIDTHPTKEHAVLFMATDPRNYKYLCDEIWMHGDGTQLGEEIARYVIRNAYRVNKVLIDSSAKGNKNEPFTTFEKIQNVLFKYGYMLQTYKKDETGGIANTRTLLMSANNEPALFIFDDLIRTIYEIEGYMYDSETFKPACVSGETLIDTPSGQYKIKDLVDKEFYIYSYSNKKGRIDINKANNIRKTKEKAEIWKLTMDRGVLFATPEHLIMLRNGSYKALCDLKTGDSLMPLYRSVDNSGYTRLNLNNCKEVGKIEAFKAEHRFVYECIYGEIPKGMEIHHKDNNFRNHSPDNLEMLDMINHQKQHINSRITEVICITCGEKFTQNKFWQKHCSKKCRQKRVDNRRGKPKQFIKCVFCNKEVEKIAGRKYCSRICKDKAFTIRRKSFPSYNRKYSQYNHKVISIEFYSYEDVYNMEVENDNNFCANGIFVHNCIDNDMCDNLYALANENTQWRELVSSYKLAEQDRENNLYDPLRI